MADAYKLTVRARGTPQKERFGRIEDALAALERQARELERSAGEAPFGGNLIRRLDPVQIVAARLELSGPRALRAGVDVRGDGSSEAYTGRVRRRVVQQRPGESAYDALRRELA